MKIPGIKTKKVEETKKEVPYGYTFLIDKIDNGYFVTMEVNVFRDFDVRVNYFQTLKEVEKFRKFFATEEEAQQFVVDMVAETITKRY